MGKKHWLLRRVGAVIMTTGLLSSGMWGGASSGVGVPVVWAQEETTAPAADTASPKRLPDSVIKNMTVTADPNDKDKVVLTVDFAFPDDAKPGDYIRFETTVKPEVRASFPGFDSINGDIALRDSRTGKTIAAVSGGSWGGFLVKLTSESEGLVNRTAQFTRTTELPVGLCERDPLSVKYIATTTDSQGNEHEWDLFTTVERKGGKCNQNINPIPHSVVGAPIPRMACETYEMELEYLTDINSFARQGAGVYGEVKGTVFVTPPIGDAGGENETFQDIYVRVRVDDAYTPMKMTKIKENLKVELNTSDSGFSHRYIGGWTPRELRLKIPKGGATPPQTDVYPPDFDLEGVKAKAQPGTNGLSKSFDWNSKTITKEDATALGKLLEDAYKAWQEAHKPEVIGFNDDPANGTVYVDYKIPGLYKPVIMKNAWGEDVDSLKTIGGTTVVDDKGNADANAVASVLKTSALYRLSVFGGDVFAPYSGAAKYNTILTYSTDPESYKSGKGHTGESAHYGSCGEGGATPFAAVEGVAAGDPLPAKPVPGVSVLKTVRAVDPANPGRRLLDQFIRGTAADANEAPGIAVAEGTSLTFRFIIRNSGNTVLKNLRLADDKIPADKITCGSSSLDTVVLQPAEEVTCRASLDGLKPGEQHTNIATVTATPVDKDGNPVDGGDVTTQDPANAHGAAPGVELVKKINAVDANTAQDAVVVDADSDMSVMFEVTNTGDMPLKDIVVSDDVITDPSKITCPGRPEKLNPGAKLICYATLPAPQAGEMHTNTGTVTATPVDKDGNPVGDTPLTDSDPANARVPEATPTSSVAPTSSSSMPSTTSSSAPSTTSSSAAPSTTSSSSVEPTPSSASATSKVSSSTTPESPTLEPVPSEPASVESTTSTPVTPTDEPAESTTPEETTTSEKPAESEPSSTLSTPVESTTADKPEESTPVEPTPVVPDVPEESVEPQRPQRLEPGIAVVKKINGRIAREGEGVETQAGTDMAITFEVTNTGNTTLKDVVVGDDVITDSDAIVCDDADRVLAAGEVMTCSASYPAPEAGGKHINTVTVTGVPVDEDGHELESGEVMAKDVAKAHTPPEVHDDSEGVVKTPGISVTKLVNGEDADVAPGVMVASGSGMEFVFDVANTGDVALTGIELGDDVIASEDIVCADKPEILAPGEHFVCRASLVAPESGGHVNIATVEAMPVYADGEFGSDALVRDCDVAHAKVVSSESESRSEELVDVDEPEVDESIQHDGGVSSEPEGSQEHGASVIVQQVVQHGGFVDKKAASTTVKKSGVRVTTGGHLRAA
ncbi:hypothetical protein EML15_05210 [Corynebacterium sp. sy017]|uniref:DUF7507 domain-containing protein n=1 Tax=unclassified Corynebacterium TaxID=2624378 RepID=UPI001186DA1D|nr:MULTISPECIES: hypothetical protein [unclassified Corynebacterium]MBP3088544.1 hypothetical protein [Corynebacterium sp. sy017]TSD91845.1 hypothetical protein ELY17_05210 [Corynebacterium sp. SY003]